MDDVWDEKAWEIFEKHLPDEDRESRVLITSRFQKVAAAAKPSAPPLNLRVLNDEEGWEFFLSKAFPNEDGRKACQREFEKVGKEIVKKCGGLPLALVVVGGLLSQKESLREWDKIAKTMVWQHEEKGKECIKILALSYADLPQHLKWCFLYLGAFPEYFDIEVDKLIRLWIAEGFIQGRQGMTLEDLAEQYLEELVLRCLVHVGEGLSYDNDHENTIFQNASWKRDKICRIHDLLRELAIEESKDLDFFHCQQKEFPDHPTSLDYSSLRRFSINAYSEEFSSFCYFIPRVRTLLGFKLNMVVVHIGFPANVMQLIRVIDLEGAIVTELPKQVGELANLRYLGLRRTWIKSLPTSIQNLSRLQSLDVRDTKMEKMNSVVWKIKTLRQVLVDQNVDLNGIQQGILRNLRVLEDARAGDWMNGCLSRLTNLQKLLLLGIHEVHHHELSIAIPRFSSLTTLTLLGVSIPATSLQLSTLHDLHWV